MGLLDFIFGKKKEYPTVVPQKYSPIEPYDVPHSPELDKIPMDVQRISAQYDQVHRDNISAFDYRFIQDTNEKELSGVEKIFLKYICGRYVHDTYIAGYWTHTHKIDYRAVMSKFFNLGLIEVHIDLQNCTVKSLKDVLRKRGLPISGKKRDLIARIERTNSLPSQEAESLEKYRKYTPTKHGADIISTLQEDRPAEELSDFPKEMEVLFTKEEVNQHKEEFFIHLRETLQKENLTVQAKELYPGWRFLWHDCQIGQIVFTEFGHKMQWISGASVPNYENILQMSEEDINKYIHATCGDVVSAEGLTLQDCIDKIPYWIQHIRVLIEDEKV